MGYHTGVVSSKDLFATILNKIKQTQPEAAAPYWVKESSLDSDSVYTSSGASGTERIVLTFEEKTIGLAFTVGYAKDYTPGAVNTAGTFTTLQKQDVNYYTSQQHGDTAVTYHLSVTADRIILHVQGDKLISGWQNTVMFLGMPIKYDTNDKLCILKVSSENATTNGVCPVIEDSIGVAHRGYSWYHIASPGNPSWGDKYFVETFHFGYSAEGLRGELDGLFGTNETGLVDGDQIDVNGNKYLVIIRRVAGNNNFPRTCLLMRMA